MWLNPRARKYMVQILNAMLDEVSDEMPGSTGIRVQGRQEGAPRRPLRANHHRGGRHHDRERAETEGKAALSAVIERYRHCEESVEEALNDMYLSGFSIRSCVACALSDAF